VIALREREVCVYCWCVCRKVGEFANNYTCRTEADNGLGEWQRELGKHVELRVSRLAYVYEKPLQRSRRKAQPMAEPQRVHQQRRTYQTMLLPATRRNRDALR
jgi:hypothetical protein